MALIDIYNLAFSETTLRSRVSGALLKLAAYILAEAPEVTNHANRLAWAKAVLVADRTAVEREAQKFLWNCATNGTIQASAPNFVDNDIEYVVGVTLDLVATSASPTIGG